MTNPVSVGRREDFKSSNLLCVHLAQLQSVPDIDNRQYADRGADEQPACAQRTVKWPPLGERVDRVFQAASAGCALREKKECAQRGCDQEVSIDGPSESNLQADDLRPRPITV